MTHSISTPATIFLQTEQAIEQCIDSATIPVAIDRISYCLFQPQYDKQLLLIGRAQMKYEAGDMSFFEDYELALAIPGVVPSLRLEIHLKLAHSYLENNDTNGSLRHLLSARQIACCFNNNEFSNRIEIAEKQFDSVINELLR